MLYWFQNLFRINHRFFRQIFRLRFSEKPWNTIVFLSGEKSDCASDAQSLHGIAKKIFSFCETNRSCFVSI